MTLHAVTDRPAADGRAGSDEGARPLAGLRVLDRSNWVAGSFAAYLLGAYGADVVKLEPAGGSALRWAEPTARPDTVSPPPGLLHLHLDAGKRSVLTAGTSEEARTQAEGLARWADVLVEDQGWPDPNAPGVGHHHLRDLNPRLVVALVSQVRGEADPVGWQSDIVAWARSGAANRTGIPGRSPLMFGPTTVSTVAGALLCSNILASLFARRPNEPAPLVDIGLLDAAIWIRGHTAIERASTGVGDNEIREDPPRALNFPVPCRDGFAGLNVLTDKHWQELRSWLGVPDDPRFADDEGRRHHDLALRDVLEGVLRDRTREDLFLEGCRRAIPVGMVLSPAEVLNSSHLRVRGFVEKVDDPLVGTFERPAAPVMIGGRRGRCRGPAPRLGQHSAQVMSELTRLAEPGGGRPDREVRERLPLEGVRVLDATQWWSGPMCTMLLADLGAEVLKVESVQHPDPARFGVPRHASADGLGDHERSAAFSWMNRNKLGITLDLTGQPGQELFGRLVSLSHVVVENLRPGVFEGRFGLSFERLRKMNPNVVFVRLPGYGCEGPWSSFPSYASPVEQLSGFSWGIGYQGGEPTTHRPWQDETVAAFAAFATLATLWARTGAPNGQGSAPAVQVDASQLEVLASVNALALMEHAVNGRDLGRLENDFDAFAPHGFYPCHGHESWVAIAVRGDEEWRRLCQAMGEGLAGDEAFARHAQRICRRRALDARVADWTSSQNASAIEAALRDAGIACAVLPTPRELIRDPAVRDSCVMTGPDHGLPARLEPGAFIHLSGRGLGYRAGAPTLGADNETVLGGWIGVSEFEMDGLRECGVIGTNPGGPSTEALLHRGPVKTKSAAGG